MSLSYAIIGCGRISPNHIAAAQQSGLNIVAICDVVETRMNEAVQAFSLTEHTEKYTDYRKMLQEKQPDLVAICTESGTHATIAIDCIQAGCHLIIEKPIALSLEDADRIIELARQHNVKVSACHQNRFNKSVQKIREAVESERFGRLLHATAHIRWSRGESYYLQAPWRGTWAQDGGALMNQCIHNIDLLRWMMGGDIIEVMAMTDNLQHDYIEAEDFGAALIRFRNGSYGIVEGTTNVYPTNLEETLYIFGNQGTVKAGGKSVNIIEEWRFADETEDPVEVKAKFSEDPPSVYGFGHTPLYEDVVNAIQQDREPYVTAQDGRDALELVLAIYKAAAQGSKVEFPLDACSTAEFQGRFVR